MIKVYQEDKEDPKPKNKVSCPVCNNPLLFANDCDIQVKCTRCKKYIKIEIEDAQN